MRARIAQMATPRRLVATECCIATVAAALFLLILGATPLALIFLAVCPLAMAPALAAVMRLERRSPSD
jgi:hypothetical protein